MYELHLKEDKPGMTTITYDISQLFDYIDKLTDLSCLVYVFVWIQIDSVIHFFVFTTRFQRSSNMYAPFPKDWIKEKIFVFLKREAGKSAKS